MRVSRGVFFGREKPNGARQERDGHVVPRAALDLPLSSLASARPGGLGRLACWRLLNARRSSRERSRLGARPAGAAVWLGELRWSRHLAELRA